MFYLKKVIIVSHELFFFIERLLEINEKALEMQPIFVSYMIIRCRKDFFVSHDDAFVFQFFRFLKD